MGAVITNRCADDPSPDRADDRPTRAALQLLVDHMISEGVADLDRPHVLTITEGGHTYVSGPYADAQAALCALEDDRRANADVVGERSHRVTPLLPPFCPHLVERPADVDG
ncbi:hypothetical protein [Pimelobacter simplex]|uniref:hypothetical protein n=1 Tax=Nocardioides simplex TaxID=2045 RepID=UPI001931FDD6|nr:hypothetical protein [Pimelobacter simplex]